MGKKARGKGCDREIRFTDGENEARRIPTNIEEQNHSLPNIQMCKMLTDCVPELTGKDVFRQFLDDVITKQIAGEIKIDIVKNETDNWKVKETNRNAILASFDTRRRRLNVDADSAARARRLHLRRRLSPVPQSGDSPGIRVLRRRRLKPENRPIHRLLREIREANGLPREPPELPELK